MQETRVIGRQNRVEGKEHGPYVPSPGSESVLCHLLVRWLSKVLSSFCFFISKMETVNIDSIMQLEES